MRRNGPRFWRYVSRRKRNLDRMIVGQVLSWVSRCAWAVLSPPSALTDPPRDMRTGPRPAASVASDDGTGSRRLVFGPSHESRAAKFGDFARPLLRQRLSNVNRPPCSWPPTRWKRSVPLGDAKRLIVSGECERPRRLDCVGRASSRIAVSQGDYFITGGSVIGLRRLMERDLARPGGSPRPARGAERPRGAPATART